MVRAIVGANWGDEGKGKITDYLASQAELVVRYQGGNNAGHTVVTNQGKFVLNLLPSGILHSDVICILGDGMVVDLEHLANEIKQIEELKQIIDYYSYSSKEKRSLNKRKNVLFLVSLNMHDRYSRYALYLICL